MSLAILATVATIAVPRYSSSVLRYRVDLAANRLVHDLEYAGTLARVRSAEVTIKFTAGANADESLYVFEGVDDPDQPGKPYLVVLRTDPYRVILTSAAPTITFRIDGLPKSVGSFVLDAGPHHRTVDIDLKGETTIQ